MLHRDANVPGKVWTPRLASIRAVSTLRHGLLDAGCRVGTEPRNHPSDLINGRRRTAVRVDEFGRGLRHRNEDTGDFRHIGQVVAYCVSLTNDLYRTVSG